MGGEIHRWRGALCFPSTTSNMPNNRTHCAISKQRTGFDFKELHRWIDGPSVELGWNHRLKRHYYNDKDEKYIREYWDKQGGLGEKAVVEWLFHIALDNLETAFKKSRKVYGSKTFNFLEFGLARSGYIYSIANYLSDKNLKDVFGDSSS